MHISKLTLSDTPQKFVAILCHCPIDLHISMIDVCLSFCINLKGNEQCTVIELPFLESFVILLGFLHIFYACTGYKTYSYSSSLQVIILYQSASLSPHFGYNFHFKHICENHQLFVATQFCVFCSPAILSNAFVRGSISSVIWVFFARVLSLVLTTFSSSWKIQT